MRQDTSKVRSLLAELFDPNRNDTLFFDLLINYGDAIGFRFSVFDLSHDDINSQWRMYSFQQRCIVRYNIALVYQSLANSKSLFSSFGNDLDDRLESELWTIDYFLDPVVVDSIIACLEY